MEKILKIVCEYDEKMPYLALQRKVGMPHNTFRRYIKELRNLAILEKPSSKSKKAPITFTPDARSKYPYAIDLPNTLLSSDEIREKQGKPHWKAIRTSRKDKQAISSVRSSIITQYFLIRAVYGTSYRRTVTNQEEQGQTGLIRLYEDRRSRRLFTPGAITEYKNGRDPLKPVKVDLVTKDLKDRLKSVMVEIVNIPGVSVMDLVSHRDVGSGQYFWYIKEAKRRECNRIVQDLVSRKILVKMSNEEVDEALKEIKQREYFDPLLREKRYKIASEALGRYISDWDTLQHFISKWIEGDYSYRNGPHRSQKERDLYEHYVGHKRKDELSNRPKKENEREISKEKKEVKYYRNKMTRKEVGATHETQEKVGNKPVSWVKSMREKLEEMKDNPEHVKICRRFPILQVIFMKPIRDVLEELGMKELVQQYCDQCTHSQ